MDNMRQLRDASMKIGFAAALSLSLPGVATASLTENAKTHIDFRKPQIGETRMECVIRIFTISYPNTAQEYVNELIAQQCSR